MDRQEMTVSRSERIIIGIYKRFKIRAQHMRNASREYYLPLKA